MLDLIKALKLHVLLMIQKNKHTRIKDAPRRLVSYACDKVAYARPTPSSPASASSACCVSALTGAGLRDLDRARLERVPQTPVHSQENVVDSVVPGAEKHGKNALKYTGTANFVYAELLHLLTEL